MFQLRFELRSTLSVSCACAAIAAASAACQSSAPSPSPNPTGPTSVPATQTLTASMLSAPVNVLRDEHGIPHIYGDNLSDVSYAEGYVMAADRLVEMDLGRRQAEGTLSELFGSVQPSLVPSDMAMRMQDLTGTSRTAWQALKASSDPADQALASALTFFAAGVNAYVADLNAGKYSLPNEGLYTTESFTPWTEIDSYALGYLQAFELAYDPYTEFTFTQMIAEEQSVFDSSSDPALRARKGIASDFEILAPQDPTFTLPSGWTGFDGDTSQARSAPRRSPSRRGAPKLAPRDMLALIAADEETLHGVGNNRPAYGTMRGSNNFILGPDLTADHHVIIGNDTHLSLSNPPIFYLVQLVASGGPVPVDAMGVAFPGIPGIVLGNNSHVSWAATTNYMDVTDIYQETLVDCATGNPFGGTGTPCAVFKGKNVPTTARTETFKVGYAGHVSQTLTETYYETPQHGPLVPQLDANNNFLPLGPAGLSIKYTGREAPQLLRAFFGVATSSTMQEAVAALDRDFGVGGQNWLIGDDQGNFGWTQVCSVPRRAAGHAPWLVLPGDGSAEWGANMARQYIPHAYNPSAGFLVTANNDPIGVTKNNSPFFAQPVVGGSPLYLGFDYDTGTRAGRITKRIQSAIASGHKFTQADVASIQGDTVSEWGEAMAPTFLAVAGDLAAEIATPGTHATLTAIAAGADPTARGLVQQAHDIMAAWTDFETPSGVEGESSPQQIADSKAALLNAVFYSNFAHLAFDDEIALLGVTPIDDYLRKLLVRMCTDPGSLATGLSAVGDNILFDNLNTPSVIESKEQIAAQAVVNTLDYIVKALGPNPSTWAWGSIHTLTLAYLLPVGELNLPPTGDRTYPNGYPRHGDDGTVDVGAHGLSLTNFTYNDGPAIRFGADLVPGAITAQNALPGGETFDPSSPHYQDQLAYWLRGTPFPLANTTSAVVASAQTEYATDKIGRLTFNP